MMQGRPFYGENYQPREYIFAARDRCDETPDLIRAVRTHRFKYIRNFFSHVSHMQPNRFKDTWKGKSIQHMRQLYMDGLLKEETARYFSPTRTAEELYDLENDPWEMHNLAGDPAFRDTLQKMQDLLVSTIFEKKDLGFIPEPVLEDLGRQYGTKYYILQQPENLNLVRECMEVMELDDHKNVAALQKALEHERAPVRFWAAYGLGNIPELSGNASAALQKALNDDSDAVKIAAARALCRLGHTEPSLQILAGSLSDHPNVIIRLYSALFIQDLNDSLILKVLPEIEKAKNNSYDFAGRVNVKLSDKFRENAFLSF